MDYRELNEFLRELADGGELSDFELVDVENIGHNDAAEAIFAVIIGYGALSYRTSSYLPARAVRLEIMRLAREIIAEN